LGYTAFAAFDKGLKSLQVVGLHFAEYRIYYPVHYIVGIYAPRLTRRTVAEIVHVAHNREHGGHVHSYLFYCNGVAGECFLLNPRYIRLHTARQRHYQRDADNTDASGERR
jgi:hypothetical protein